VYRLRHLNAAEADQAGGLPSLGRQPARREHRARRPHNLSAQHRHRQNRAGHLHAGWARVQVRLVVRGIFHRRVARNSALLRQRGRLDPSAAVLNVEHRLDYVSLAVRRLRAGLPTNCKPREKEGRARMVNLADSRGVERRPQLTAARDSQSLARKNQRKEHRRQGLNNSGAIFTAAPEQNFGAACF
jgi:hypothetical protein